MPLVKPVVGALNWGGTLNTALDYLDAADAAEAAARAGADAAEAAARVAGDTAEGAARAAAIGAEVTRADAAYLAKAGGTITATGPAVKPLVVKGAAAQTASLLEAQNSAGVVLAKLYSSGAFAAYAGLFGGPGADAVPGSVVAIPADAASRGLVVRAFAAQTANLQEWQNSAGTVLGGVQSDGRLYLGANVGGMLGITNTLDVATRCLVVKGFAAQTANLQEFLDSASALVAAVLPNGALRVAGSIDLGAGISVQTPATSQRGIVVRGRASQTSDLQQWQLSSGVTPMSVDAAGRLNWDASITATTATAGTSGALPAQAAGYAVVTIGGAVRKIPYYNS